MQNSIKNLIEKWDKEIIYINFKKTFFWLIGVKIFWKILLLKLIVGFCQNKIKILLNLFSLTICQKKAFIANLDQSCLDIGE